MPESEEQPAATTDPTKTLVHGSDSHYYVIYKSGITRPLTPEEENHVRGTLQTATDDLTNYFNQPPHDASLASGVRIRIAELF